MFQLRAVFLILDTFGFTTSDQEPAPQFPSLQPLRISPKSTPLRLEAVVLSPK
ncbi:MAG: hypothetical protein MJ203_00400 [archaeon]|nr:hypothetical protein [archaeon]